ncbi:TlpA disulfide reductase family protein [Rhodanobacter sp. AS-Z3]|uniref:TlpA family protein disulfide reductase n=1 Tax=Rhodanobacter sp. AS-Z3 TaxID=3031330 RepID=UPI0031F2DA74
MLAAAVGGYVQHRLQNVTAAPDDSVMASSVIGQPLPALSLPDLDGKLHRLSDYRGHRVLINFWASWCLPCLQEMPALVKVQQNFGDHGPIVVGIAMDEPVHVRAFLAVHPVNYPILVGKRDAPSTSLILGNRRQNLPYSVLVGDDGRILATHEGAMTLEQMASWLSP